MSGVWLAYGNQTTDILTATKQSLYYYKLCFFWDQMAMCKSSQDIIMTIT